MGRARDKFRVSPESNLGHSLGKRGLMAPGVHVTSTAAGGGYRRMSGTSAATPFVTGTIALLWSLFPQATPTEIVYALITAAPRRRSIVPPVMNAEAAWHMLKNTLTRSRRTLMSQSEELTPQTPMKPPVVSPAQAEMEPPEIPSQTGADGDAPTCGTSYVPERSFIYAIGTIGIRFPSLAIEKEFAQAVQREKTEKLTDEEVTYQVLKENRYLAREVCFVLSVENIETYLLLPNDSLDLEQLVEGVKPARRQGTDCDVVIGLKGPIAPPNMCNGLMVPLVYFDQIYSFDIPGLIKAMPKSKELAESRFRASAEELFHRIMQLADNAGERDEHRALNYLAARYPRIYDLAAERFAADFSLTSVEVHPSRLSGVRKLADVIFSYTSRKTDVVEKYYVRVDVTEKYPFLVSKLAPFYDRQ